MLCVRRILIAAFLILSASLAHAGAASADFDNAPPPGINPNTVGMQPLVAPFPVATPAPGESRAAPREDGSFDAIPLVHGHIRKRSPRRTPRAVDAQARPDRLANDV